MSGVWNAVPQGRRRVNLFGRAAMLLGFVFVAISLITLNVNAASNPFRITDATITAKSAGVDASIDGFEDTKINASATFHQKDESITYSITLKNTSDSDFTISEITDDNSNSYLSYTYDPHAGEVVAAGADLVLEVTVTYAAEISGLEARIQDFGVKFSLGYEGEDDNIAVPDTSEGAATPDTGAATHDNSKAAPTIILTIVGAILLSIGIFKSKFNGKTKIAALMILCATATGSIASAAKENFTFEFANNYSLKSLLSVNINGEETTIEYGGTLPSAPVAPQKDGYNPDGWKNKDDGTPFNPTAPIYDDVDIEPSYRPIEYVVAIDTDGDSNPDSTIYATYDDPFNLPDNENTKPGHTPNGWTDGQYHYDDGENSNLTTTDGATINLSPDFKPNQYTVNLDTDGDGTADETLDVTYGETTNLPDNAAEKPGYSPNGWTDGTTYYNNGADISGLLIDDGGEITLSPDWTLETYTITYQYYGTNGNPVDNSGNPTTYTINDDVTIVAPNLEGYRFLRWSIPKAGVYGDTSTTVVLDAGEHYDNLAVYGWYEQRDDIPYVVKHYIRDINGNFALGSLESGQGKAGTTLQISNLKKNTAGYTMLGAFDTDSGTTMPSSGSVTSTTILANGTRVISIYYRPYELRVKYNLNGGSLGEGNTVYSSKDGYLTPIDDPENTEFLAGVYGGKVTLAYATGEGINIEKLGHYVSQSYQWAVGPEVGAFAFEQGETGEDTQGFYYQDLSRGDKTMTMYLDWTEEIYMINYYEAVDDSLPTFYTVNRQVTIPALTTNSNGQYFDGWSDYYTGEDLGMSFTIPVGSTGRRFFRANWRRKRYHIEYDANGGTGEAMATTTCNYNDSCTLESNNFTREYFSFAGWTINDSPWYTLVGPIVIDKSKGEDDEIFTAYAIWEPYPEVQYLGNGSDAGEMPVQKIKAGEEVTLLAPNFSRDGYGFVGWNTKADGTGTLYGPNETINQMPYGGLTLYATWLEAEQGVTMQTFDKSAEPYASYYPEQRVALRDERDGNVYVVTKLTNDIWWMAENLRLNPNDANTSINEFNTNNPAEGFAEAAKALSADELWSCANNENCSSKIGIGLGNIDRNNEASPTASNRDSSWYGYGVMYNYYTAVAGNKRDSSGNADGDICPSGWHIPTGGATSGRDFYLMYSGATSGENPGEEFMSAAYRRYAYNLVYSGSYTKNASYGANSRGSIGRYWSSTQQSNTTAYVVYLGKNGEKLNGSNYTPLSEYAGYAVRCIANTPTTYSLFYEKGTGGNAATNMPANQTVTSVPKRHVFTVSSTIPELEGHTFLGWGLVPDGTDIVYQPGDEVVSVKIGITLYARWEKQTSGGSEYEAMQSMTTAKCAEMEVGTMANLQDTRDNKVYRVGKLADNNCWMLDTLKIANVEISDEDSDLPEDTTFVLPDSNDDAFEETTQNTPKLYIDPINNHGVFYSYYTATAGWGVYGNDNLAATTTDSPQSICPKGWKLPSGGNSYDGDFNNLVSVYGQDQTAYMGEFPGFELDGALSASNGKVTGPDDYGHRGYFWTSTNRSKWFANRFLIIDDVYSPEISGVSYDFNYYKYWENNIVCIAR